MLWDDSLPSKRFSNLSTNSFIVSTRLLSRLYNYNITNIKLIWRVKNESYYYYYYQQRKVLRTRFFSFFLTKNANRGTNKSIAGLNRAFRVGTHSFFLSGFLGFSFERTRAFMRKGLRGSNKFKRLKSTLKRFVKYRTCFNMRPKRVLFKKAHYKISRLKFKHTKKRSYFFFF